MKREPISRRENALKGALIKHLRAAFPYFVILPHQDGYTAGIPDISISGNGRTSWWECKHGTPEFKSTGIQELTCLRLARNSYCRYIIWKEKGEDKETLIVHPLFLKMADPEVHSPGFDHHFVERFIRRVHV